MERYVYHSDGSAVFSGYGESSSVTLALVSDELKRRVKILLAAYPNGLRLEAQGGADYFVYNLTVYDGGRAVTYYWTDGELPRELHYLASLLKSLNNFASRRSGVIFYVEVDKLVIKRGETLRIAAVVLNPTETDFVYFSPTPCSPDFRMYLRSSRGVEIELCPDGSTGPCIQVIQERVLKAGGSVKVSYSYMFGEVGTYFLEAFFPYAQWSEATSITILVID